MKKYIIWNLLFIKRQFKKISFLFLFVIIPLITLACSNMSSFNERDSLTVLLLSESHDELADKIINTLIESKTDFDYVIADSEEEIHEKVRTREVLCGYVFKNDFTRNVVNGKHTGNIKLILRKDSSMSDATNEQVYSLFLKEYAYQIGLNMISESTGLNESNDKYSFQELYDNYYYDDVSSLLTIEFLSHDTVNDEGQGYSEIVKFSTREVMAIVMLMGLFMGLGAYVSDTADGTLAPLKIYHSLFSKFVYISTPVSLLGLSTLVTILASKAPETVTGTYILDQIGKLILYEILLIITGIVATYIIKKRDVVIAMEVISVLLCLVICPVFVDLSGLLPIIRILRYFLLPSYYILF